ncbi:MAG: alpha/beta fold hydrolase [Candidatus Villigracilaceae bacterium]
MMPVDDLGGNGPRLYFAHANGYPPACYRPLLERLSKEYHVLALRQRPLWPEARPEELKDWRPLADDLNRFLAAQAGPAVCVGHSMGAIATLRAALRHPQHFKAILLLEPVLLPPEFCLLSDIVYRLRLGYLLNPLVLTALRRRQTFESQDIMFANYRRKAVFRYFSDENLLAMVQGLTRPAADGAVTLVYSPQWEARIYATAIRRDLELWRGLPRLQTPTMIIRGAETDTFWERTARLVNRYAPQVRILTLPACSHLLPMEQPQVVAQAILDFLKQVGT